MKNRVYAMEEMALAGLLDMTAEMFATARGMSAEGMRTAIADIYADAQINRTPESTEEVEVSYEVDTQGKAHIPITGVLVQAVNPCAALFASAETEYGFIRAAAEAADQDPSVRSIAFEVNSPGGEVNGVGETAQIIAGLRKPTVANVHGMAASAAYWLASQAGEIVALSPASQIGSIGVAAEEWNDDKAMANAGIVHRVYTSTDAPDKRPDTNTEEGQAKIVAMLDDLHTVFAEAVADGRDTTAEKVNSDFGRGGLVIAKDALKAGMIDGIVLPVKHTQPRVVGAENTATAAESNSEEVQRMDLATFKAEHPDVYGQAAAAGVDQGVMQERERVEALRKWNDPACAAIVAEAIADGGTEATALPRLMVAMRGAAVETPEEIETKTPENGAGAAASAEGEAGEGAEPEVGSKEWIAATLARVPVA